MRTVTRLDIDRAVRVDSDEPDIDTIIDAVDAWIDAHHPRGYMTERDRLGVMRAVLADGTRLGLLEAALRGAPPPGPEPME